MDVVVALQVRVQRVESAVPLGLVTESREPPRAPDASEHPEDRRVTLRKVFESSPWESLQSPVRRCRRPHANGAAHHPDRTMVGSENGTWCRFRDEVPTEVWAASGASSSLSTWGLGPSVPGLGGDGFVVGGALIGGAA